VSINFVEQSQRANHYTILPLAVHRERHLALAGFNNEKIKFTITVADKSKAAEAASEDPSKEVIVHAVSLLLKFAQNTMIKICRETISICRCLQAVYSVTRQWTAGDRC